MYQQQQQPQQQYPHQQQQPPPQYQQQQPPQQLSVMTGSSSVQQSYAPLHSPGASLMAPPFKGTSGSYDSQQTAGGADGDITTLDSNSSSVL
jgi:hypothetical protein